MTRPAMYRSPMPRTWFLKRRAYRLFMLREATSVFIAAYLVVLLVVLGAGFGGGPEAFAAHLAALTHPLWRAFHAIALAAAVFHAVTWFNFTPKAMPVQIGRRRVAEPIVAAVLGYVPWAIVTALVLWAVWV